MKQTKKIYIVCIILQYFIHELKEKKLNKTKPTQQLCITELHTIWNVNKSNYQHFSINGQAEKFANPDHNFVKQ